MNPMDTLILNMSPNAPKCALVIEYDIMPDGFYTGVGKMRAVYNKEGDLCVHFNGAPGRIKTTRQSCIDSQYPFFDINEVCPEVNETVYPYILSIPKRSAYLNQKDELDRIFQ